MWWYFIVIWLVSLVRLGSCQTKKPHIIVIMADDMGFNDVGFHGSDEIPTPNIDAMAYNGVILNSHYTQALCTPSRSAFLTGKYPIHLGMQHLVILEPEPWGLPLNETLLPQYLKNNGYKTHAVGKWHLGFFKKEYTPTYRGFDTHFGYWQGLQDYYNHFTHATFTSEYGYDMHRNMETAWEAKGKYSTTLFTEEAEKLIREHDVKDPMFLYLAHLAPHTGNDNDPLQAPDEEISKFSYIADPERRIYAAMVSMLDKSVGRIFAALREKRMLENSIVLFISDNGSQTQGIHANHGSNFPFRGMKNSPWEGAMRGAAAIWSPLIKKPQRVSNRLMHLTDWIPTFFSAAGLNQSELNSIDGVDMWKSISEDVESPRTEILHNIDDVYNYGAIRQNVWKYLYGSTSKGAKDNWYGSSGKNERYHYDQNLVLSSQTATSLAGLTTYEQIKEVNTLIKQNRSTISEINFAHNILDKKSILTLRQQATIKCDNQQQAHNNKCDPMKSPCLFNIEKDPCEKTNVANSHPDVLKTLEDRLKELNKTALPIRNLPRDPRADPAFWNDTWINWRDFENTFEKDHPHTALSSVSIGLISTACVAFFVVLVVLLVISGKRKKKSCEARIAARKDFVDVGDGTFTDEDDQVKTALKEETEADE